MSFKKRPQKISPEAEKWIDSAPVRTETPDLEPQPQQRSVERPVTASQSPAVAAVPAQNRPTPARPKGSGGGVKKTTLEIPVDLYREFKKLTVLQETTMREVIVEAIGRWVRKNRAGS